MGYTIREIELIDAHIKFSQETFQAYQDYKGERETSMFMKFQILSAIQRINKKALNVFRWHISNYGIDEYKTPVNATEETEPSLLKFHFEDEKGNTISKNEIKIDEITYLVINTKNAIGKSLKINLDDNYKDFEHNGNAVINDVIDNIKITGDTCRVQLKAVKQTEQ